MTDQPPKRQPGSDQEFSHRYGPEPFLCDVATEFLATGLSKGEPGIIIASRPHWNLVAAQLKALGFTIDQLAATGKLAVLDAETVLSQFMVDDFPDRDLFDSVVGARVAECVAKNAGLRIRVFTEMMDVLARSGNDSAANKLEELWMGLGRKMSLHILIAHTRGSVYKEGIGVAGG
jgi:KaiC/GvpD/RAD55 family RecA-like ATPase